MAGGRIKGLTVTIDGDTTGLSKALQNVTPESTAAIRPVCWK